MNIGRKIFAYVGLIAIVPFLASLYLLSNPAAFGTNERKIVIVIISVVISLGIFSLASLVKYLSRISSSLSALSGGNIDHRIAPPAQSGVEAQFASSINHISRQLRESADELERRSLLIERSNLELKRLGEMKLQFLSQVAHELRTPLINIEKSSFLLLDTSEVAGQNREFIRIINENSKRLMRLINELLDMSKLEAGMFILKREQVAVGSLFEEAGASVARWRQSKNLDLRVDIEQGLPTVYADKDRIVQVLINLLSNSIKFTPIGGRITMTARRYDGRSATAQGECVEIIVSDTGEGIPADKLPSLFEKYKASAGGGSVAGTGLGLPIAKQIIEVHGGSIRVESRPGKGAGFAFTIPCVQGS